MNDSCDPRDEHQRLASLYALEQLDRPPEERFDRLVRLARRLFDVDTASITLVDEKRQYFRAIDGLDLQEGPREGSFCTICTRDRTTLVVEDAREDPRFADSAYVTGPPHIRFYAGVPLKAPDDSAVATLCIFGPEPRPFGAADVQALEDLAAVAAGELNASWWGNQALQQEQRVVESRIGQQQAEETGRAKIQFLAHMSHEIRTPLNGVLGMLQLLQSEPLSEEQLARVRIARNSGEHLLRLIDDALDLSRMEIDQIRLQPEVCDLRQLGEDVLELIRSTMPEQGGPAIHFEMADDLPSHLMLDILRIKQILINLLGNAAKFTADGTVALRFSRREADTAGDVSLLVIEIEDTGRGMTPDQLARIFKPFVQVGHADRDGVGGSGLGLAITRGLVTTMGGKIQVRSQPGEGTLFTVSLPLQVTAETQSAGEADPARAATHPGALHVLLVDDDPISARIATAFLERDGHSVLHVANGRKALEELRQGTFNLVLMDIGLPDVDGMQVTVLAREARPDGPPIIALTAYAREEDRKAFLAAGMAAHLQKPIRADALRRTISQVMASAGEGTHHDLEWDVHGLCERLQQDERLLRDLLNGFLDDLPSLLQAMNDALHAGDRMGLVRLAHRLRGQFGNLCAEHCEELARKLEYEALGASMSTIEANLDVLRQSIDQVLPRFQAVVSSPPGAAICSGRGSGSLAVRRRN